MKAVGYVRVSTNKAEQAESLENQKALFLEEIKSRGYDFYDFYVDVKSGTTEKRESLEKMLDDIERGKFNVIISKELSRLARNVELAHKIKRIATRNDVHIITLDGAIDTTRSDEDRIKFTMYAGLYESESYRTSKRIKDAFKTKYKQGLYIGSIPPYGYETKEKKLYIREDETPNIVKLIFGKFLEGWGFDKIARHLSKAGHPTPAQIVGKKNAGIYWYGSTIRKILTNPHYTGDLVQCRETSKDLSEKTRKKVSKDKQIIVKNTHEAIISKADFNRVQEIINKRKRKGVGKQRPQKHLFTNFLTCKDCGKSLWYVANRKGYVCGNYYKHGKIACSQHKIVEKELEKAILNDIRNFAKTIVDNDILDTYRKKVAKNKKSINNKIKKIDVKKKTLEKRKSSALDLLLDEVISQDIYNSKIDEIDNDLLQLEKEKFELNKALKQDDTDKLTLLKEEFNKILKFDTLTKGMLNRLVDKILVSEDGNIEIHYNFANPLS